MRMESPFDAAIILVHEWAIEYFQWKLSIWSVEEALVKEMQRNSYTIKDADSHTIEDEQVKALQRREQRFREVVQGECERPLLLSLPRDCVRLIISDYLFISDSILNVRKSSDHPLTAQTPTLSMHHPLTNI